MVSVGVSGQYVNVPDTSFRKLLKIKFPSCFNIADQLDTICASMQTDSVLNIQLATYQMEDLTGVQYFTQLQSLRINFTNVNYIPKFPPNLTYLEILSNVLLPNLPDFPNTLKELHCEVNPLITRFPNFPNGLTAVTCQTNALDSLPKLPPFLKTLDCSWNNISTFSNLPNGLEELVCDKNLITSLPPLSTSLTRLICNDNKLQTMPLMPNTLRYIECNYNLLTSLPPLPNSLYSIDCSNNQLTSLPNLPDSLLYINCEMNQIYCLPILPSRLYGINFDYPTKISCIPNTPNSTCDYGNNGNFVYPPLCDSTNDTHNCLGITLPLKLLSFTAQKESNNVLLNWQTANEVNVSHINVQRSINNKDFVDIGKVKASCCAYSFVDGQQSTVDRQLYYRLEMVDKDGSKTYSEVKTLNFKLQTLNSVSVFPNPAKDIVNIECVGAKQLLIIDYLGRTVYQSTVDSRPLTVSTKQLTKGIYVVKAIMNNGEIKTEKLLVE